MGWNHGAEDVADFEAAVARGELWWADTELLRQGFRHAVLDRDKHGRANLVRAKRRGPIDAVSAVVFAVAYGERLQRRNRDSERRYGGIVG